MNQHVLLFFLPYCKNDDVLKWSKECPGLFGEAGVRYLCTDFFADLDLSVHSSLTSAFLRENDLVINFTRNLTLKERQDIELDDMLYFLVNRNQLELQKELRLNMEGCNWVNDSVIEALPKFTVSLNIGGISTISNSAVKTLLERHRNLEELVLDAAKLEDEDLKDIAECSKLKKLCVSSCEKLTDTFLGYIKSLQNLTCLKMKGGVKFTKKGLVSLLECGSLKQLVELDLSHSTKFDDDCVNQMIQCCGATLEILYTSFPVDITENGFKSIFLNCRKLKDLHRVPFKEVEGPPPSAI